MEKTYRRAILGVDVTSNYGHIEFEMLTQCPVEMSIRQMNVQLWI